MRAVESTTYKKGGRELIDKFRLKAYEPWGNLAATITSFSALSWTGHLNDHSTLSVTVPAGTEDAEFLRANYTRLEIALEARINGRWKEPYGCRFLPTTQTLNPVKDGGALRLSYLGVSQALRWATVWDATPGNEEGKRVFEAQSPGAMLDTLMWAARRRTGGGFTWAPGLAWTFTNSADSAGNRWGKNASNTFTPSASLEKVLQWLASKGAVDWRTNGRELQVYQAGTMMGRRNRDVRLRDAFATSTPQTLTLEHLASSARFRGENGVIFERDNPAAFAPFGRIERWSEQGQVKLEPTAQLYLEEIIRKGESPLVQYRREWAQTPDAPTLWEDYQIGDWVLVGDDDLRIVEAGVSMGEDGAITGFETLGTRIEAFLEVLARKTTDLSDGMVGGENSPITVDDSPEAERGVPKAPVGLQVTSDAVVDAHGFTRSVVSMRWEPVTRTIEDKPVRIDSYIVRVVKNRRVGEALEYSAPSASYALEGAPLDVWDISVRAVSRQNVVGQWSASVSHTLAADRISPPQPVKPVVSSQMGILTVTHSGLATDGYVDNLPMPPDVDRWEVAVSVSDTPHPTPCLSAADAGGGVWNIPGLPHGVRHFVRVRAIDRSGNVGPWSDSAFGEVALVFDPSGLEAELATARDELGNLRVSIANGSIIAPGAIKTAHLASYSVDADKIAANAITAGKIKAGALDAFVMTGATVQTRSESNRGVKLNSSGLVAYDNQGNITARITGSTGEMSGLTLTGGLIQTVADPRQGMKIGSGSLRLLQNGKALTEINQNATYWRSPTSGSAISVMPSAVRSRVVMQFSYADSGWEKPYGSIFMVTDKEAQHTNPYEVGSFIISGNEKKINSSGRAELILGEGNKWKLCHQYGYDQYATIESGWTGTISMRTKSWIDVIAGGNLKLQAGSPNHDFWIINIPSGSGGTNLYLDENWKLFYEGSARKLKADIRNVTVDPRRLLDVPVRDWVDRGALERYANYLEDHAADGLHTGRWDAYSTPPPRVPGLVAEEVLDAGLDGYVQYRGGEVAGLYYDRLWTLLIPLVKDLDTRLSRLEQATTTN